MKKTLLTAFVSVSFSCQAGPLSEYDERVARERSIAQPQYVSQVPIHEYTVPPHNPHFLYPPIEPLPAHVQASIENETDLLDEIKNSISNLIEWFTS